MRLRLFVCAMVCALLLLGLLAFCHHDDIKKKQQDFQGYHQRNLLPDDVGGN